MRAGWAGLWAAICEEAVPVPVKPDDLASLNVRERLKKLYESLRTRPRPRSSDDALRQIGEALDEVEDRFSGIPRKSPPPPPDMPDGRMYPPLEDNIKRLKSGKIVANTKRHKIVIEPDGGYRITNRRTREVEFERE